jgi:hypothetical protein
LGADLGGITFSFTDGDFNAFSGTVRVVPEPASALVLLALGGAALRRRSA